MKKRLLVLFTMGLFTFSFVTMSFPMTVKADNEITQEMGAVSTEEVVPETSINNIEETESEVIGDELIYILNAETKKSEETPCQVTAKFNIPSGFNLNAYMDIMHDDGTVYRILTTDDNGYSDFAFVKEGHYIVLSHGVINDAASRYTFTLEQDNFTVDAAETSVFSLKATMDNYDEIAQTIAERTGEEKQELDETEEFMEVESTNNRFATNIEGVTIGRDGVLYYETISNSKVCTAQVYGNATGTYDLYFEVIKAGVIGEAEFKVSLDGGQTFIGTDISANDYSFASRGLYITFTTEYDTDELEVGDTFTASVPETFAVSTSHYTREPNVIVSGHPAGDYQVSLTILSTGERGVAKYSLSLDNGVTTEYIDTIPEDGVVTYGELTYHFSDAVFSKGITFTSSVKSNIEEVSYMPLYLMGGAVIVLLIAAYIWLSLQKEKPIHYRIRTWADRQDESKYQ